MCARSPAPPLASHSFTSRAAAAQVAAVADVGTPANWQAGEDVVVLPSVPDNEATAAFPRGFTAVKPYLRIVPQPEVERVRE